MSEATAAQIKGYDIQQLVGRGGFGDVYAALQPLGEGEHRRVAIKVIRPEFANHNDFIRRFEYEAQTIARLEHPHIVPLYDYWRDPTGAYLVMRWMDSTLYNRAARTPLSAHEVTTLIDQVASALALAHRRDVVHRDIKPANILLDEQDNAYLADFGIARSLVQASSNATQRGAYTPGYAAPEQIIGAPATPQMDIYSLGVVLCELVVGGPAFQGDTHEIVAQQLAGPPPNLRQRRPDITPALEAVVLRATARDPQQRYADALSLAQAVRAAAQRGSVIGSGGTNIAPATEQIDDSKLVNPYKGLRPFDEADSDDFFGRERLIERLLRRLTASENGSRFLAVVGASGSGKSSAVRAGLLPALRRDAIPGSRRWFIVELTPGQSPLEKLEAALLRVATSPPANMLNRLQNDERGLVWAVNRVLPSDSAIELVLVLDQFEELFTMVDDEARRAHLLALICNAAADPQARLRVVITLRADFMEQALRYVNFGELMRQRTELVTPLAPDELEQAVIRPAKQAGVSVEPALVSAIVSDVGARPGVLPQLQYALTELFEQRSSRVMRLDAYRAGGGVMGALARRAEALYAAMPSPEQAAVREVFLRLVTLGEGTEDTRRRVRLAELRALRSGSPNDNATGALDEVLRLYGSYRLLIFDHDSISREPTVEVAHEALIRSWARLRTWLDDARADMRVQRTLGEAAAEWEAAERDASFLPAGTRLEHFAQLVAANRVALTDSERAFVHEGVLKRGTQEKEARRRARTLRLSVIGLAASLVVALLMLLVSGGLFLRATRSEAEARTSANVASTSASIAQRNADDAEAGRAEAEKQRMLGRERFLTARARNLAERELDSGLLLSLQANRLDDSSTSQESLLNTLNASPKLLTYLRGHERWIYSLAYSPDGTTLASAGSDGTIALWNVRTRRWKRPPLTTDGAYVHSMVFISDNQLAVGYDDGSVVLWDTINGLKKSSLGGGKGDVKALAFNPLAFTLVAALRTPDGKGELRVWNLQSAQSEPRKIATENALYGAAFNKNGSRFIAAGAANNGTNTVLVWNATLVGEPERIARETDDSIFGLAFSTVDPNLFATGGEGGDVTLWNAANGQWSSFDADQLGNINSVGFSPDGTTLAAAGDDLTIATWNIQNVKTIDDVQAKSKLNPPLTGHSRYIMTLAFNPVGFPTPNPNDIAMLASAGADQTVVLWDINQQQRIAEPVRVQGNNLWTMTLSNDGRLYAVGDSKGNIAIGDAKLRDDVPRILLHDKGVVSVAFNSDASLLASGSKDQTIGLYDVIERRVVTRLKDDKLKSGVYAVAFSPDRTTLAAGYGNGSVALWDVRKDTYKLIRVIAAHTDTVWDVAFSKDGKTLAAGSSDRTVSLWNVADGEPRHKALYDAVNDIYSLTFSPDGNWLAAGTKSGQVILWNAKTFEFAGDFVHVGVIWSLAFSSDSSQLVSGGSARTLLITDVRSRTSFGEQLVGNEGTIYGLAFAPGDKTLISGAGDGTLLFWNLDPAVLRSKACTVAQRNLDKQEWQLYMAEAPPQPLCPIAAVTDAARTALSSDRNQSRAKFKEAVALAKASDDRALNRSLCWQGATLGFAEVVIEACDHAVQLDEGDGTAHFCRGMALVALGTHDAAIHEKAIKDLQMFLGQRHTVGDPRVEMSNTWIKALKEGSTPLDSGALRDLWNQAGDQ